MSSTFARIPLLFCLATVLLIPGGSIACGNDDAAANQFPTSIADREMIRSLLGWGTPVALDSTVNDSTENCRPSISFSGDTLYFQDEREGGLGGKDIWRSIWDGEMWGNPVNCGSSINSDREESKPYISADGTELYFLSNRSSDPENLDIYVASWNGTGWDPALPLNSPVNSQYKEGAVSLSFDGERLYFQSDRPGGYGNHDLYVSRRIGNQWGPALNLGPNVNTSSVDWFALETPGMDGLYITQERPGGYGGQDLWLCEPDGDSWTLPVNAGLPLNNYINCSPSMTGDGLKLFFGGGHLGEGYGDLDLWMSVFTEEPYDTIYIPEASVTEGWERTADLPGAEVVLSLAEVFKDTILAGTYPGGRIYRTVDDGEHWELTAELPGAIYVFSLLTTSSGTVLAGTFPNGDVFRSTDGGDSWFEGGELDSATEIHCLIEAGDGSIFAGTAPYGDVFVSTDDGQNWEASQVPPETDLVVSLLETEDGILFAGTLMWTGLFRSTNSGVSWHSFGSFGEDINHPSIGSLLELDNGDLLAGHLSRGHGAGRGVYRSTDGGVNWSESGFIPLPLNEVWSMIKTEKGDIYAGIATTYDYIVYRSTSDGHSWERTGVLSGARETFCLLETSDGTLFAGTSPEGDVFRMREPSVGIDEPVDEIPGQGKPSPATLRQNYPNPFNPSTVIPYSLAEASEVEISLYNLLGQKVKTLVRDYRPAGDHSAFWDGKDERGEYVASGIYLLRLRAGATIEVRKIVLLR